jgi:hypothetical protein
MSAAFVANRRHAPRCRRVTLNVGALVAGRFPEASGGRQHAFGGAAVRTLLLSLV